MPDQQEKYLIRLTRVDLENVRNVEKGHLDLLSPRGLTSASLLGLYGQNGSGKSTLIEAMKLLKYIVSGASVPKRYQYFISRKKEFARLGFKFKLFNGDYKFEVLYSVKIRYVEPTVDEVREQPDASGRIELFDECLKYRSMSPTAQRITELINTSTGNPFGPLKKFFQLVGSEDEVRTDLLVEKSLASKLSRSFIFSGGILKAISEEARRRRLSDSGRHLSQDITLILATLKLYAQTQLFVLTTDDLNLPSYHQLPLYWVNKKLKVYPRLQKTIFSLDHSTPIENDDIENLKDTINGMNVVLSQIVPGLSIGFICSDNCLMNDGRRGVNVELTSRRYVYDIPLRCESEGILKIIEVLQLLICVFNMPYVTVAIDELDSGIFEYLLGELLNIISEQGKGQLIFTSHNLRPLETINKDFIAFTTTDVNDRYTRLKGVKTTNNLRDFYFRKILLGGDQENIYNATSNAEIAFAMRMAYGVFHG